MVLLGIQNFLIKKMTPISFPQFLKVDCSCLHSLKEGGKMACTLSLEVYQMKNLTSCRKKTFLPHSHQVIIQGLYWGVNSKLGI